MSFSAKPLLIAVGAMTALGVVLYMVTRKAEAKFEARRDNVVTDQLNAAQRGETTEDVQSAVRRELFNESGSQNVRSGTSGTEGLYYGDAAQVAARQADRRAGVTRVRPSDGSSAVNIGNTTPSFS